MLIDDGSSEKQIGFIAQNLEQYFPWLVDTDSSGKKEVSYAGMTPVIVRGIQEVVDQIRAIGQKLDQIFDQVIIFAK
jgi:hypothetical protein